MLRQSVHPGVLPRLGPPRLLVPPPNQIRTRLHRRHERGLLRFIVYPMHTLDILLGHCPFRNRLHSRGLSLDGSGDPNGRSRFSRVGITATNLLQGANPDPPARHLDRAVQLWSVCGVCRLHQDVLDPLRRVEDVGSHLGGPSAVGVDGGGDSFGNYVRVCSVFQVSFPVLEGEEFEKGEFSW